MMTEEWTHEVYDQHIYKGIIFSGNFSRNNIERCSNLRLYDDDVVIYTYMRSGTTLTQHIVWGLCDNDVDCNASIEDMLDRYIFMENQRILARPNDPPDLDKVIPNGKRKLYKTHLPLNMLPKDLINGTSHPKLIIVIRNPFDVAVSCYNFYRDFKYNNCYSGTWDEFFDKAFIGGNILYGRWFDWMKGLAESDLITTHSPLILSYEDFLFDLEGQVERIANFLNVPIDETKMIKIRKLCDIKRQKSTTTEIMRPFIRNGETRKWNVKFTNAQVLTLQKEMEKLPSRLHDYSIISFSQ